MNTAPTEQTYTAEELAALVIRESSYVCIEEVSGKFKAGTYRYKLVEENTEEDVEESEGLLLDLTTANFIQQFLAKVTPETKSKLLSLPITNLISLMYRHISPNS